MWLPGPQPHSSRFSVLSWYSQPGSIPTQIRPERNSRHRANEDKFLTSDMRISLSSSYCSQIYHRKPICGFANKTGSVSYILITLQKWTQLWLSFSTHKMDVLYHRSQMETDLMDHLINDKSESCGSKTDERKTTENRWGSGNTEDFIGVLYLVCKPPVKHTPGKVGYGKSGSPMPNIVIVPTMYHTYPITYTYPYERNSSISSLKPQFE